MNNPLTEETERGFVALEQRVGELIHLCHRLAEEKKALQAQCADLVTERQSLIEQNDQLRARVDAMVARLKSLEQSL